MSGNTFSQTNTGLPATTDYQALVAELKKLKEHVVSSSETTDDHMALTTITQAEDAAKRADGKGLLTALSAGGRFVGDVATKLSASLIVELMKAHHLLI